MESEDRFLSYEEIVKTCSWLSEVCGLNERHRTAVSQLRKLFVDSTVEIKSVRNRGGYQLTVVQRRKNGLRFSHAFLTLFSRFSHDLYEKIFFMYSYFYAVIIIS
ncbi:hypothetical protein [uncultured Bacteroides sp.]|uniref:hypothetical protein n=1 Tax=uncultured Bacteroides sp. TaxID=162156 RepID=UPI00260B97A7|nr:hypothetical protein [uncultured Bacteroides sp.]